MWTEVSFSVPHLLHKGLLIIPIKWRCLLRILWPVRRPVTSLDWVRFKNNNLVFVVGLGPKNSFLACLWALLGPHHIAKCCLSTQHFIFFFYVLHRDPQGWLRSDKFWTEPSAASLLAILLPHTPACPGTQYSPTVCRLEISFNVFWHCCTSGEVVLAAWRAFKAAWLSEKIQTYFSGLTFGWISLTHSKIAYTSAWETVACFPREILSLLPNDCS